MPITPGLAQRQLQTSDATTQGVLPVEVPVNSGVIIEGRITAIDAAGNASGWKIIRHFKRQGGNVIAGAVATTQIHKDDGIGVAADPDFAIVGGTIEVDITGKATTVIDWGVRVDYIIETPPT